jgi:sugar porter (SP) family MFS transporter
MMVSGPLSDRIGRRNVLFLAAVLYAVSAIASALAPTFTILVIARMIGGLGVGASLIIAPMYIAEIAPAGVRGRMVSFNQLNIVVGISAAFFTNYLILRFGQSDAGWAQSLGLGTYNWRWMLGLETLPAVLYFVGLFFVPESPRWLMLRNRSAEATGILSRAVGEAEAQAELEEIRASLAKDAGKEKGSVWELFAPAMRLVLTIGIVVAILQQITGINAVFFYAPMIFEQSGIGTDASFAQAVLVGLANLVFTIVAILVIDRIGRKPLLTVGLTGIAVSMSVLAFGFSSATYTLTDDAVTALPADANVPAVAELQGTTYESWNSSRRCKAHWATSSPHSTSRTSSTRRSR